MLLIVASIGWAVEIGPPDTSSPRATFESFRELSHELAERYAAYQADPNRDTLRALINQVDRGQHLMDLSQVAPAGRREVASQALGLLLDVVARVELPRLEDIPDARAYAEGGQLADQPAKWRLPGTGIVLERVDEGQQAGEFLLSWCRCDCCKCFSTSTSKRLA